MSSREDKTRNAEGGSLQPGAQRFPGVDLHRHLLGSARPQTLWEFARKYDLDVGRRPFDEFHDTIVHRVRPRNLERYIAPWALFRDVVREPEDIWRIAYEAAQDARIDGVCYVEFRSSLPGLRA